MTGIIPYSFDHAQRAELLSFIDQREGVRERERREKGRLSLCKSESQRAKVCKME